MTGSSTSFTCMQTLLLLALYIALVQSIPKTKCKEMHEININVFDLGKSLKSCSDNCSSAHITDRRCKCFNISLLQGESAIPGYFIEGLKSLLPRISNQAIITDLVKSLKEMYRLYLEIFNLTVLPENYEPFISPKSFHKKLEDLIQQINTICNG